MTDFGIALDLSGEGPSAAAAHDVGSVRSHGRPTGGFHKKQMVGAAGRQGVLLPPV